MSAITINMVYNQGMAVITPNTDIYLLKCPLELDQTNQISFASATAQQQYFMSLPKLLAEDNSYQRKDGVIRFPAQIDSILEYNYVMYKNDNYSDKWFYAFITNMEYLNDSVTAISIKTDAYQTYMFDMNFKSSFIEREHVSDDTFGLHTLDEGLSAGEYVAMDRSDFNYFNGLNDCVIVAQLTYIFPEMEQFYSNKKKIYGGLPNGTYNFCVDTTNASNLDQFVRAYDTAGKAEAIVSMYLMPKNMLGGEPVSISVEVSTSGQSFAIDGFAMPDTTSAFDLGTKVWAKNSTIDGYSPKNNKCFCYPYNYLLVSNNGGTDIVYHWEDFNGNASFELLGVPSQSCTFKLSPTNYKRRTSYNGGYLWAINGQKLPVISWLSDYYLNWQAKNGTNSIVRSAMAYNDRINNPQYQDEGDFGTLKNMIGVLGSAAAYGSTAVKAVSNKITGAAYKASEVPDQSEGNAYTGDLNFAIGKSGFTGYNMCAKAEVIKVIDNYFSMYGYKVSNVKIPNLSGRRNWNYVKTIGANIEGNIPQDYVQELKDIFDSGITIWHNPATFLDYSQNNSIVN